MVTLRKRVRTDESSRNSTTAEEKNPPEAPIGVGSSSNRKMASKSYEEARDERIKENFLRMQKLGILDLTQKLKSRFESSKPARKETPKPKSPPLVPPPRRRSSRLQKVTPGCHAESRKDGENSAGETKILGQDGNDARVPSGAKRARVLLVSEDGVVHFAQKSNPKSVAVPRLSSARKSDPKHTAAPENSAGETKNLRQNGDDVGVPSGAKRAKILLVSEDGVVHFAHESNPKSVAVLRQSVAVLRLRSDKESDPKHTTAPENLTGETKIWRQDGDDVGVPSGAKRAKILLVSEDGAVHFAHESNPKSGAVSRLSSDRESDSKHTAAPQNCSNSACFGERRAQALVTPSESEVKPSMVPQQSSDNVILAPFHYMPEPVMPATANSNDVCNGELGYKVTGIGAVSEPKKDAEAHLCSDSIYSVASSGKTKFSLWICDRTAGERDDICGQEKATETFKQVEGEGIIQVHTKPFP